MIKTVAFLFVMIFFMTQSFVFASEIQITPVIKYSTCKQNPKEGDYIEFVTVNDAENIKAGTKVLGLLTERKENGFSGQVASFYIEQFKVNGKNLDGIIYQKGNNHKVYFEYYDWIFSLPLKIFNPEFSFVRGGEAFLRPNEDIFTLYLKD